MSGSVVIKEFVLCAEGSGVVDADTQVFVTPVDLTSWQTVWIFEAGIVLVSSPVCTDGIIASFSLSNIFQLSNRIKDITLMTIIKNNVRKNTATEKLGPVLEAVVPCAIPTKAGIKPDSPSPIE